MIKIEDFGKLSDGRPVRAATLDNQFRRATILSYGGRLHHYSAKDGFNIVRALPNLAAYEADEYYHGALIGRFANRIHGEGFSLDGQFFPLPSNEPLTCLHGGPDGFHLQNWEMGTDGDTLVLRHTSPNGHMGFPGDVEVQARISLMANILQLEFRATTTKPTPLSLTWHPYFNLSGEPTINDHKINSNALFEDRVVDHSYSRDQDGFHAMAQIIRRGRALTVFSDYPEFQLYTGDHLPVPRSGFAVEPQFPPNDPNEAQMSILRPDQAFKKTIFYKLELETD